MKEGRKQSARGKALDDWLQEVLQIKALKFPALPGARTQTPAVVAGWCWTTRRAWSLKPPYSGIKRLARLLSEPATNAMGHAWCKG